jgi:hypothetical protein
MKTKPSNILDDAVPIMKATPRMVVETTAKNAKGSSLIILKKPM